MDHQRIPRGQLLRLFLQCQRPAGRRLLRLPGLGDGPQRYCHCPRGRRRFEAPSQCEDPGSAGFSHYPGGICYQQKCKKQTFHACQEPGTDSGPGRTEVTIREADSPCTPSANSGLHPCFKHVRKSLFRTCFFLYNRKNGVFCINLPGKIVLLPDLYLQNQQNPSIL